MPTPEDNISKDLDKALEDLHTKVLIGWIINDGQPHTMSTHATSDGCIDQAKAQITTLNNQARIEELENLEEKCNLTIRDSMYLNSRLNYLKGLRNKE